MSRAGAASQVMTYAEAKGQKPGRRLRWADISAELQAEYWPQVEPSFKLTAGETVFTIGSCFARSIEANLKALGCKVPMLDFFLPPEEFDGQPNAAMNKFHPPAFRQCLEWTARIFDRDGVVTWDDCEPLAFEMPDGRYADLDMAAAKVPKGRFVERRQQIYDTFANAFTAECMMMTPGLIEAWRDMRTGLYMFGAPVGRAMASKSDRWRFEVLSFQRCLEDLLAAVDVVRERNPKVKILITTSPVPIGRTFTGRDIGIANTHSKAVLRAVCDAVLLEREGIDYFPSYEMAMLSNPGLVWKPDRLHVSQSFVGKIVRHMLDHYMEGVDAAAASYQRARTHLLGHSYLDAEAAAREALEAMPEHLEARILLGAALAEQRRWPEAEIELRRALEIDPERSDASVYLANVLARMRRTDEAVALLLDTMKPSSFTISDLVAAKDAMGYAPPEDAVRLAERAVELLPRHIQAHEKLASALLRAGRKAEALVALRRAARLSHPPSEILMQLALLLIETGERGEALGVLDAALNADPNRKDVARLRAELLAEPET